MTTRTIGIITVAALFALVMLATAFVPVLSPQRLSVVMVDAATDPTLALWAKASAQTYTNGQPMDSWVLSQGTNTLTGTTTGRPTLRNVSGTNEVWFDGTNDVFTSDVRIQGFGTNSGSSAWWQYNRAPYNGGGQRIWAQLQATDTAPELGFQKFGDNKIYAGWTGAGGDKRISISATATLWPLTNWTHYALTWTNGGQTILYVNGIMSATNSGGTITYTPADTMYFGTFNSAAKYWLAGSLDDFRMYAKTLTSNEVFALFGGGRK
jgi:hypothetical protein